MRRRVYTNSVSHAHLLCTYSLRDVQTRTRLALGVCSAHVMSLHFSLSIRMFHPPCSRTVTSTPRFRLHLPCRAVPGPQARVKRTSARAARSLASWPIQRTPQDAYLGGLMEKQRGNPSHQEEDSEDSDHFGAEI